MFKAVLLLVICFAMTSSFANHESIKQFDLKTYSPKKYGLKDLVFEVRIEGLEKDLKERFALTKLNNPYFKVYWVTPGRFEIQVEGLPKGFDALKNELKQIVANRMEYVIPGDLNDRLLNYDFKEDPSVKNGMLLKGEDKTHQQAISKIEVRFSSSGDLQSLKTISPSGSQKIDYQFSEASWSHSKKTLKSVAVSGVTGIQKTEIQTDILYGEQDGFGLPRMVETKTTLTPMTNTEDSKSHVIESRLVFSNYRTNTGEAQRYFQESQ